MNSFAKANYSRTKSDTVPLTLSHWQIRIIFWRRWALSSRYCSLSSFCISMPIMTLPNCLFRSVWFFGLPVWSALAAAPSGPCIVCSRGISPGLFTSMLLWYFSCLCFCFWSWPIFSGTSSPAFTVLPIIPISPGVCWYSSSSGPSLEISSAASSPG